MLQYTPPIDDIEFVLFEVLDAKREWLESGEELTSDLASSILNECGKLTRDLLSPLSASSDQEGARWEDGNVVAPKGFAEAVQSICDGGWLGIAGNPQYGGQGLPKVLTTPIEEMFWASNTNLWLYVALTYGATYCIDLHASEELKAEYLPLMYEGKATGAMALTESHAGTDLGLLRTKAEPLEEGRYKISGTKIFITSGEHELTDNIVHLVLARIVDAPSGTRGISLFLVPKYHKDAAGNQVRNGFSSGSIEHKMGIRGSATSVINYEDSIGYLVGEPNRGLNCMFAMMNTARLSVGTQGLGLADKGYQAAASYAKERLQGRAITGPRNAEGPADPIVEHPDVRRMLMTQRAYTEGSRAFAMFVAQCFDRSLRAKDEETRERNSRYVDLLTPITKAFITDRAMDSVLLAQLCFGGHGYIQETGIEQVVRDTRISQIYEGTNGIQAMDLIGRKVVMDNGNTVNRLIEELSSTDIDVAFAEAVSQSFEIWRDVTAWLCEKSPADFELPGAVAADFMSLSGHVLYAYLWARMSFCDNDEHGKSLTAEFYFSKLLPIVESLQVAIRNGSKSLTQPASDWF